MNKRLLLLLVPAIAALLPCAASAQEDADPYTIDPDQRASASTPTPAGIIVNTNIPLWGYTAAGSNGSDRDFDKFVRFDIIGYIDAWQLGFSKTSYGTVGTIYFRDIGRDGYSAPFFFQYGTQSVTHAEAVNSTQEFSRTIYAIGSELQGKYDDALSLAAGFNVTVGVAIGNDDVGSALFFQLLGNVGARIPIGISGASVQAYGAVGTLPDPLSINSDAIAQVEVGLRLTGALGLNL